MYLKDITFYTNSDFSKLCFRPNICPVDVAYRVFKNPLTIKQYREFESSNREIPRQLLLQTLVEREIKNIQYYGHNYVIVVFKTGEAMGFLTEKIHDVDFPDSGYGLAPHLVLLSDITDNNTKVDSIAPSCNDKHPQEDSIAPSCNDKHPQESKVAQEVVNQSVSTPQFDIPYDIITELRIESLDTPRLRDKMSKLIRHYQLSDEALIERLLLNDSSPENNQMIDRLFELRYFYPIHSRRDFSIELFEKYQKRYLLKLLTKHIASERNRKNKFKRFTLTHDFVSVVRETKPDKALVCELLDEIASGKCPIKADVFHVLMKEMI